MNLARMHVVTGEIAKRLFDLKSKRAPVRRGHALLSEAQVAQLVRLGYESGYSAGLEDGRKAAQAQVGKALGLRP